MTLAAVREHAVRVMKVTICHEESLMEFGRLLEVKVFQNFMTYDKEITIHNEKTVARSVTFYVNA